MSSAIYMIFNLVNEKFYIGSAINLDQRLSGHVGQLTNNSHYNRYLQLSWNKYGASNFQFYKLEDCEKDKLLEREQHYIDLLKPEYNLSPTAGSNIGVKYTEESKARMSAWQIGRKMSDEARAKMSKSAKGNNNASGYKHPPEVLIKLSKIRKGKKHSEETKRKIGLAGIGNKSNTGRKLSEEHKSNIRKLDKWPHELGRKCKCQKCKNKKNIYMKEYLKNKYIAKQEFEITQVITEW